jgi:hypothetical protein
VFEVVVAGTQALQVGGDGVGAVEGGDVVDFAAIAAAARREIGRSGPG